MQTKGFVVLIILYCIGILLFICSLFLPYGYCGGWVYPGYYTVPRIIYGYEAILLDFYIALPFLLISLLFTILFVAIKINAFRYIAFIAGIIGAVWLGFSLIYWLLEGIWLTCGRLDPKIGFTPGYGSYGLILGFQSWILICIVNIVLILRLKKS